MSARLQNDPLVEAAIRRTRRSNLICSGCGERRHVIESTDGPRCYACRRVARGWPATEDDHLASRATWGSLTIRLAANDHRSVTELRAVLGFDRLPDAGDDPLLLLAHLLAGIATLLALLVEYLVAWASELQARYGATYAAGLPSPVLA